MTEQWSVGDDGVMNGVYQINTSSYHSIVDINSMLK